MAEAETPGNGKNDKDSLVAFVTGGSKGIGRGVAIELARNGYDVALLARNKAGLEEVAALCRQAGARTLIFAQDIRNYAALEAAVKQTAQTFGGVDVLINGVGCNDCLFPVSGSTFDEMNQVIELNYFSAVQATRFCLPYITKSQRGGIVYFSSFMTQQFGIPGHSAYTSAKSALPGFAKCVFEEVREHNIKVCTIFPGMVNSESGRKLNDSMGQNHTILPEEMLQVEDVVDSVMYALCTAETACSNEIVIQSMVQPNTELKLFTDTRPVPPPEPAVDLSKQVAFITGASKGIGREIAVALARRGYDVALLARSEQALEETANLCREQGVRVATYKVDVTDIGALEAAIKNSVEKLGNLTILVSNAGVNRRRSALTASREVWDQVVDTNLRASMHATRAALPYLQMNRHKASIFYVSSTVVQQPGVSGVSPYFASKHGLIGFASCVFEDVRHLGIKVCSICPGLVNTEMGTRRGPVAFFPERDLIQSSDVVDAMEYVLDSSRTCCPIKIMMHPQKGLSQGMTAMRNRVLASRTPAKL